ncbi:ribulose-phosphate 3-epimerase [Christensenellaceae bacterium]|nr:ribulose-phosphate 3-epimerase [Christensenellaceae bacterium]BDF60187.1 ribulose-phosphate 3-epimerase [Christensenellaceae bacterium]
MKQGISASVMCVNFADTKKDLCELEKAKIEYLHFDIMDGTFVPNYALGTGIIDSLRDQTDIAFDIHLMVTNPEQKINYFNLRRGDAVSVHAESTFHIQRILANLKDSGLFAGVALNPGTPIETLDFITDVIDFVLIMTVNPGFAGQKAVPSMLEKISRTKEYLLFKGRDDVTIQVDGNVSFENASKMKAAGADNFVAGTSGIFRRDMSIAEAAAKLHSSIGA